MNECKLVQDLWPLYVDNELSSESLEFINSHVQQCPVCRELPQKAVELPTEWDKIEIPDDSAERFLRRIRRRRYRITAAIGLAIILIAGSTWYYGQRSTRQAYMQQEEEQRRIFREQVAALEEVSPPPEELLQRWGITHTEQTFKDKDIIEVNFSFHWQPKSAIEHMEMEINGSHWFDENLLINAETGASVPLGSNGWSSDQNGMKAELSSRPLNPIPQKLIFKTRTLYAFLKNPEQSFLFDYQGGAEEISLNQEFTFQGIKFNIDRLKLDDKKFTVEYRQITPANEVGVFQLDFMFDDRLGNSWSTSPELVVSDPKTFSISAPYSPAKHWALKVTHVIQVIPGVSVPVNVKGEGVHE